MREGSSSDSKRYGCRTRATEGCWSTCSHCCCKKAVDAREGHHGRQQLSGLYARAKRETDAAKLGL